MMTMRTQRLSRLNTLYTGKRVSVKGRAGRVFGVQLWDNMRHTGRYHTGLRLMVSFEAGGWGFVALSEVRYAPNNI